MADSNLGLGGNPYLDDLIGNTLGDMTKYYQMAVQPGQASNMAASGSFGNSGVQAQTDYANNQFAKALGQTAGNMRANDFWTGQNFNRNVYNDTFNQQQQQFQNMNSLYSNMNAANQSDLSAATQIQNTPMNYYNQFTNTANSIGQGYGTTNQNQQATGSPLMGALGGWQLGGQFGKAFSQPAVSGVAQYNLGLGASNNPSAYSAP